MAISMPSSSQSVSVAPGVSDSGLLRGSIGLAVLTLLGYGLLYSLAGVGLGQLIFPAAANGSLIVRDGIVVGSTFVAQPFADDRYFTSRPSAAKHQPMAAGASNQARSNPELRQRLTDAVAAMARRENVDPSQVPGDLVTQSGGGFDPHISPQGAAIQVNRVARVRGLDTETVARIVTQNTENPQFGVLGAARVNVLALNLALDRAQREARPDSAAADL